MGASKTEYFSPKHNLISTLCKAFAHPARIVILENILQGGEWICEDFQEIIPLSRASIWQHLEKLETANLIKGRFNDNEFVYKINECELESIKLYFKELN